jgi:septal ring factor EnvC (AmiA/AmiB activator)
MADHDPDHPAPAPTAGDELENVGQDEDVQDVQDEDVQDDVQDAQDEADAAEERERFIANAKSAQDKKDKKAAKEAKAEEKELAKLKKDKAKLDAKEAKANAKAGKKAGAAKQAPEEAPEQTPATAKPPGLRVVGKKGVLECGGRWPVVNGKRWHCRTTCCARPYEVALAGGGTSWPENEHVA